MRGKPPTPPPGKPGDNAPERPEPPFDPTTSLKTRYRSAARKLHPDLASTDEERARRHVWMAKVNEAYKQQDEDALKTLLMDWEASPESVQGTGIPSDLVRVIRQIAHVRRRIDSIGPILDAIKTGELYTLYMRHQAALKADENLLEEMAAALDVRIADAKRELVDLEGYTP